MTVFYVCDNGYNTCIIYVDLSMYTYPNCAMLSGELSILFFIWIPTGTMNGD